MITGKIQSKMQTVFYILLRTLDWWDMSKDYGNFDMRCEVFCLAMYAEIKCYRQEIL